MLEYIEVNPRPSKSKNKKIREKIKSVASALSVNRLGRVRTEPKAKEHNNVVLSSRQPISAVYNPETASRVTLALLGTVFQTKLPTTDN